MVCVCVRVYGGLYCSMIIIIIIAPYIIHAARMNLVDFCAVFLMLC